jgi:glycine/D-amino acid oxidase-like deaminating enzyme
MIRRLGGSTEVHLFERRGQPGIENTEKSFEGFRTYWFTHEEIRFYLYSIHAFRDLGDHFCSDPGFQHESKKLSVSARYRQAGYHYFLSEKDFRNALSLQDLFAAANAPLEFYSKDEAQKIDWIKTNFDLDAAVLEDDASVESYFDLDTWMKCGFDLQRIFLKDPQYYPIAGYLRVPVAGFVSAGEVVSSYRSVFDHLGGKLHLCSEVVGLESQGSRIHTIHYRRTRESRSGERMAGGGALKKSTDYVVNASGIWTDDLNEKVLGERLGIIPHRRLAHIVRPPPGYNTDHGMVLLRNRVIRPDEDKIWLYYTVENEKPGIETGSPDHRLYDTYFFKYIYPVFCHSQKSFIRNADSLGLYGSLNGRGWMGHYADTVDERPLIGVPRPDRMENYAVSSGYSGHGVQASIAAARGLAQIILQIKDQPAVEIPSIYAADRNLTETGSDHSRL